MKKLERETTWTAPTEDRVLIPGADSRIPKTKKEVKENNYLMDYETDGTIYF